MLCHELCKNGWTDLNHLYVYNVFPWQDVTFGSVVVPSPKNLHYGVLTDIFKPNLPIAGRWMFAVCRWIAFCRVREKCFLQEPVLGSVHTTGDHRLWTLVMCFEHSWPRSIYTGRTHRFTMHILTTDEYEHPWPWLHVYGLCTWVAFWDAIWVVDSDGLKEACVTWEHIGATWRMWLNRPCAATMRPYVKLLWPLVLFWLRLLCSCIVCFCCVRFTFFSTKPRDWLGITSPKWPILCRVGEKP